MTITHSIYSKTNKRSGMEANRRESRSSRTKLTPRIKYDEAIKNYIDSRTKSSIVYVILATPVANKTVSFNLLSFGTDNKFSIDQVLLRWAIMEKQLSELGIIVLGYAADGDSRLIGSMKLRMGLPRPMTNLPHGIPEEWKHWYAAKGRFSVVYVQDTIHLVNKLKNALLSVLISVKASLLIVFFLVFFTITGKFPVSRGHLEIVAREGEEKTGLLIADLEQHDKMSIKTFEKLIDPRVAQQLKTHPGTNGTVAYITLMKSVFDSFENASLNPSERIEEIWFVTFFIRVWHCWVKSSTNLNPRLAQLGIEINAHSLISHLMNCRERGKPELFLTELMHSQHCERSFGNARSFMSGVQNTVINFDILEYLNKASRFEYLDELRIILRDKFEFARGGYKTIEYKHFEFPTDQEIEAAVYRGKQRAKIQLDFTGLECEDEDFCCCLSSSKRCDKFRTVR
ncbi:LOW QUALITY PROTEIN: uncharacterized protein LOC134210325 [Armigeres subalbatus]|uniref:LOW QUALITY PROTEIN: uncharacterized protein LOC134210325 n=1 Tax=Armigeres subalbatus TaxID=124917 RepID=UPI002ED5D1E9